MADKRETPARGMAASANLEGKALPKDRPPGSIKKEMSARELSSSPVAVQMMKNDLARLEAELVDCKRWRDAFHAADKDAAVHAERGKRSKSRKVLAGACYVLSGAMLSYGPTHLDKDGGGALSLVAGAILLAMAVLAEAITS
jgi:hypothetical protein